MLSVAQNRLGSFNLPEFMYLQSPQLKCFQNHFCGLDEAENCNECRISLYHVKQKLKLYLLELFLFFFVIIIKQRILKNFTWFQKPKFNWW